MLAYISAENSFLRSLGNRCLLLLFLCVLVRTGQAAGKASALGISLDISQGTIVILGPLLALLLLASAKLEADGLLVARREILEESKKYGIRKINPFTYFLFVTPTAAAIFFVAHFFLKIAPANEGCEGFNSLRYLGDTSLSGIPTIYCIHNITENMPWIYPPYQTYALFAVVAGCAWFSYAMAQGWKRYR